MTDRSTGNGDILVAFVEEETRATRRATRRVAIGGGLLLLVVAGYLSFILYMVRWILSPQNAALMVRMRVEETLPALLQQTERTLRRQAPGIAETATWRLVSLLPGLRQQAEAQIEMTYERVIPNLQEEQSHALRRYIREHEDELAACYQVQRDVEFRCLFVDLVSAAAIDALDAKLCDITRGYGIQQINRLSLEGLRDIDRHLAGLLKKDSDEMTRSERLQRRLVVIWLHVLEEAIQRRQTGAVPAAAGRVEDTLRS